MFDLYFPQIIPKIWTACANAKLKCSSSRCSPLAAPTFYFFLFSKNLEKSSSQNNFLTCHALQLMGQWWKNKWYDKVDLKNPDQHGIFLNDDNATQAWLCVFLEKMHVVAWDSVVAIGMQDFRKWRHLTLHTAQICWSLYWIPFYVFFWNKDSSRYTLHYRKSWPLPYFW